MTSQSEEITSETKRWSDWDLDEVYKKGVEAGQQEQKKKFEILGDSLMGECQLARYKGKNGDYSEMSRLRKKGIFIQDDDGELIDAEGFWNELKQKLGEMK